MTSWAKRPVLVTGGAGLIGHRVVHKLVELEPDITVLDDLSMGAVSNLRPVLDKVRFIKGDLAEKKTAEEIHQNTEVCFHLAARIGGIGYFHKAAADILAQNSLMNLNLWEAARSTDTRMVCLSYSMVFESTKIFPTPESAINNSPPPKTGYGFSKLMAEYIAKAY